MRARANLFGHSIHQMLIVLPLGLLSVSFLFDLVGGFSHRGIWNVVAYFMLGAGIAGGLLAAIFGLVDWTGIPAGTRAKSVGLVHAAVNVVALVLFAASFWMRHYTPMTPGKYAIGVSLLGVLAAGLGGWFGGELVNRLGVGVDEGAHLNAPSSLSGRPASDGASGGNRG